MAAVQARFRAAGGQPLEDFPADRPVVGRLGGPCGEEVVIRVRSRQAVEIHCHAGQAAPTMVRDLLVEQGCRPVTWQEQVRSAEADHLPAAALIALADARTERTAAILLDQYQGALRQAIRAIQESIERGDVGGAKREIDTLLARADVGLHLVQPWRIVVAGPPNVGKSSLINALVGYPRAIVDARAGTTRDVVSATTAVDGWPVELSDTAGLRRTSDPLERAGAELARQKLSATDQVILVFDVSRPWTRDEDVLVAEWPDAVILHNKVDLIDRAGAPGSDRPPGALISALYGEGIQPLLVVLSKRLVPEPPPHGVAMPFLSLQVECLKKMVSALDRGCINEIPCLVSTFCGL